MRHSRVLIWLVLSLLLVGSASAGFILEAPFEATGLNEFPAFYTEYYLAIDFLLVLVFFISLTRGAAKTVGKHLGMVPMTTIGVILALSFSVFQYTARPEFKLAALGPIAVLLFFLLLSTIVYNIIRSNFGDKWGLSLGIVVAWLIFRVLTAFVGGPNALTGFSGDWIKDLYGVGDMVAIFAAILGVMQFFNKSSGSADFSGWLSPDTDFLQGVGGAAAGAVKDGAGKLWDGLDRKHGITKEAQIKNFEEAEAKFGDRERDLNDALQRIQTNSISDFHELAKFYKTFFQHLEELFNMHEGLKKMADKAQQGGLQNAQEYQKYKDGYDKYIQIARDSAAKIPELLNIFDHLRTRDLEFFEKILKNNNLLLTNARRWMTNFGNHPQIPQVLKDDLNKQINICSQLITAEPITIQQVNELIHFIKEVERELKSIVNTGQVTSIAKVAYNRNKLRAWFQTIFNHLKTIEERAGQHMSAGQQIIDLRDALTSLANYVRQKGYTP